MEQKRTTPLAADAPPAIVQLHVVETAEQNTAVDVGATLVGMPLIDVVRFAVRRGPVAPDPATAAVSSGQRDPLPRSEEALFTPHVERVAVLIDYEVLLARVAPVL